MNMVASRLAEQGKNFWAITSDNSDNSINGRESGVIGKTPWNIRLSWNLGRKGKEQHRDNEQRRMLRRNQSTGDVR